MFINTGDIVSPDETFTFALQLLFRHALARELTPQVAFLVGPVSSDLKHSLDLGIKSEMFKQLLPEGRAADSHTAS